MYGVKDREFTLNFNLVKSYSYNHLLVELGRARDHEPQFFEFSINSSQFR